MSGEVMTLSVSRSMGSSIRPGFSRRALFRFNRPSCVPQWLSTRTGSCRYLTLFTHNIHSLSYVLYICSFIFLTLYFIACQMKHKIDLQVRIYCGPVTTYATGCGGHHLESVTSWYQKSDSVNGWIFAQRTSCQFVPELIWNDGITPTTTRYGMSCWSKKNWWLKWSVYLSVITHLALAPSPWYWRPADRAEMALLAGSLIPIMWRFILLPFSGVYCIYWHDTVVCLSVCLWRWVLWSSCSYSVIGCVSDDVVQACCWNGSWIRRYWLRSEEVGVWEVYSWSSRWRSLVHWVWLCKL